MASAARLLRTGMQLLARWVPINQTARLNVCDRCQHTQIRTFSRSATVAGVFEPDDLKLEPDLPEYSALNLRMRCYDFVVLEGYAKYVHHLAESLGLDTNVWAVPARCSDINTFKPQSTIIDYKYSLKLYERTVQIEDVPSPRLPILLEVMRKHAPEGVTITLKEPDEEEEEFRYIPDKEMQELRNQVQAIEDAKAERRKK